MLAVTATATSAGPESALGVSCQDTSTSAWRTGHPTTTLTTPSPSVVDISETVFDRRYHCHRVHGPGCDRDVEPVTEAVKDVEIVAETQRL